MFYFWLVEGEGEGEVEVGLGWVGRGGGLVGVVSLLRGKGRRKAPVPRLRSFCSVRREGEVVDCGFGAAILESSFANKL